MVGAAGPDQRTPSLVALVQEIVDRPGWVEGNGMAFIISGSGTRVAEAVDGDPAAAPLLHIEYSTAVSVDAVDSMATEGAVPADEGTFRFTRSGSTDQPLTVTYSTAGSATPGDDYEALAGTVTIPIGAGFADVIVAPIDDASSEGTEIVDVAVVDGVDYFAGTTATATVMLLDDETSAVSVQATDDVATEGSSPADPAEFTITRTGPTGSDLTVDYNVSGDATADDTAHQRRVA